MTSTTPTTEHETAVRDLFRAVSEAWEAGDAAAFARWYAADATVLLPGTRLTGRDEIRSTMAGAFAGPLHGTRRIHDVESIRLLTPDVALVHTLSATVPPEGLRETVTWVLVLGPEGWRIASYHSTPPQG